MVNKKFFYPKLFYIFCSPALSCIDTCCESGAGFGQCRKPFFTVMFPQCYVVCNLKLCIVSQTHFSFLPFSLVVSVCGGMNLAAVV